MVKKFASREWLTNQAYAHRGLHGEGVPENSLASFQAAIEAGLGIECDVIRTADGRALVFHDEKLDRLTDETGMVGERTVGDLTGIKLSGSDETIPTLRDMLLSVAGQVPLLLELKTDPSRSISPLCRAVRRDLEGYQGDIAIMSFDKRVVKWFAERLPNLTRGLVVTEEGSRTLTAKIKLRLSVAGVDTHFLAYNIDDLPSVIAAQHRKAGGSLLSWTVRSPAQIETATKAGAMPILEAGGITAWKSRS